MANKDRIIQIKSSKPFMKADIFIYLFIVVILLLCFIFAFSEKDDPNGFAVYEGQDRILTYNYENGTYKIEQNYLSKVTVNGNQITIYLCQDKSEYNVLEIDKTDKSVKMTESTCSRTKDCTHFSPVKGSGFIYCAPHNLKVVPLVASESEPMVG